MDVSDGAVVPANDDDNVFFAPGEAIPPTMDNEALESIFNKSLDLAIPLDPTVVKPPVSTKDHSIHQADLTLLAQRLSQSDEALASDALNILRHLVGHESAGWSCIQQKEAMVHVLKGEQDVIAALRTGAGKSMLAIVPALLEKTSTTVLVVPLKSLEQDYVRRLKEMGVQFNHYHEQGVKLRAHMGLVLVSLNRALTYGFKEALGMLDNVRRVKRICVDEVHYCLDGEHFREESLGKMGELRLLAPNAQIVAMSGTIPHGATDRIAYLLSLTSSVKVVRTSTNRPEIKFIRADSRFWNAIETAIKGLIQESRSTFGEDDRGMIFVPYVDRGKGLAKRLGCEIYAGSKDRAYDETNEQFEKRRAGVYERWFRGDEKWIVATTALSAGNDYRHVRTVIHAGAPQEMLGWIQEFSRGGRDGVLANNYIFVAPAKHKDDLEFPNPDYKGQREVYEWATQDPSECIRYLITSFCDLQGQRCGDDLANQKCSVCQPVDKEWIKTADTIKRSKPTATLRDPPPKTDSPPPSPVKRGARQIGGSPLRSAGGGEGSMEERKQATNEAKRKKQTHRTSRQSFVEDWTDVWEFYQGACPHCKLDNRRVHNLHMVANCPVADITMAELIDFRSNIQYNFHSADSARNVCMKCHCPTMDPLHANNQGRKFACEDMDLLNKVAHAIWNSRELRKKAMREFKQTWSNEAEFGRWLVKKSTHGYSSNMAELFLWSRWCLSK